MSRKKLIAIALIFVVIASVVAAAGHFGSDYVAQKLRSEINASLKKGAHFGYSDLEVNLYKGEVTIAAPELSFADSAGQQWSANADVIQIKVKLLALMSGQNALVVKTLVIDRPVINIKVKNPEFDVFTSSAKSGNTDIFRTFKVQNIEMRSGHLSYLQGKPGGIDVQLSAAEGVDLSYDTKAGKIDVERYTLNCSDLEYLNSDSTYILEADSVTFGDASPSVEITNFAMNSVYTKEAFRRRQSTRKSRHSIAVDRISIFDPKIEIDSLISIRKLHLHAPNFEMARDNRLPFEDRVTLMPQEMLTNLDRKMRIDSLTLLQGSFAIELTNKHKNTPAILQFTRINAEVTDIQNTDLNAPAFTARAFAVFEDETETSIYTRYSYGSQSPWELKVTGTTLDLEKVSPVLSGASRVEILSGNMTGLILSMNGDKHRTDGKMDFRYKDLKVGILNKDDEKQSNLKHFFTKNIGSLFYRNEITAEDGSETVEFQTERDVRKDFVGQWLDGLLRGTIETVVKPDEDKIDNVKSWFENLFSGKEEEK